MTAKAWNGGSVEAALEYARERQKELIAQGASLCDECNGEGGSQASGVCIQCRGAGVILPPDGLKLPSPARNDDAVEYATVALSERRGFRYATDPMEYGQDAFDLTNEAREEVRAILSSLAELPDLSVSMLRAAQAELRRIPPNVYGALDKISAALAAAPSSTADGGKR